MTEIAADLTARYAPADAEEKAAVGKLAQAMWRAQYAAASAERISASPRLLAGYKSRADQACHAATLELENLLRLRSPGEPLH